MFKSRKLIALFMTLVMAFEFISPIFTSMKAYAEEISFTEGSSFAEQAETINQKESNEEAQKEAEEYKEKDPRRWKPQPNTSNDPTLSEEIEYAILPDTSGQPLATRTNNWYLSKEYDKLPYNIFHIRVQKHIRNNPKNLNSFDIKRTELYLEYDKKKIENDPTIRNLTSYEGSADIWAEEKNIIYIWEVKPCSYKTDVDKYRKGLNQLTRYVSYPKVQAYKYDEKDLENKTFEYGSKYKHSIPDGEFCFWVDVKTPKAIEHVRYDVSYEVANTGMIYYSFVRVLEGKDDRNDDDNDNKGAAADKKDDDDDDDDDHGSGKDPIELPSDNQVEDEEKIPPAAIVPVPVINDKVPQPGEKYNPPSQSENSFPSRPTYVWINGNIVVATTGIVVYTVKQIKALRAYAVALKVTCDAQANGNLIARRGTVSNWKALSVACTTIIVALPIITRATMSLPVTRTTSSLPMIVATDGASADDAVSEITSFRAILELFQDEVDYFNQQLEAEEGKCRRGWWDPRCENGCTCEPSDPNESACDDIDNDVENAGNTPAPRDPLVIDLGYDGILLTSVDNGVYFDLDNNGFAERTAWVGPEDGFLVLDRNGNGKIDNGGELFGDQVILKNGLKSTSGFEALAEIDTNNDNVIDVKDIQFSNLMVWTDINQNGISEPNELFSLDKLGIVSISLDYQEIGDVDGKTGTIISLESNVAFNNDTTRKISEHWFKVNSRDSQDLHDYGEGIIVTSVESFGNIMSLNNAIFADKTGELGRLVNEFKSSMDYVEKRVIIKRILYFITGASDIAPNSRGGNIDARDLHVIEQFMGRNFVGIDGGTSPNVNAASILSRAYSKIENMYFNQLNRETVFGYYLDFVFEDKTFDNEGAVIDRSLDLSAFPNIIPEKGDKYYYSHIISGVASWLLQYDNAFGTNSFSDFKAYFPEYTAFFDVVQNGNVILGDVESETIFGTSGIDLIWCETGNNILNGNSGNDVLYGGTGDDILDGGSGNDTLLGGNSNDTYVFAKGYGSDTIIDADGLNTLRFKGLNPTDILVNGTGEYDTTITIKGTNDTLVIKDFRKGEEYANYDLEFDGVKMHVTDKGSPFRHIYGGNGDDVLKAVVDDSIMHAFGGNDTVYGSDGNDIIYGNEGDDVLYAGSGDDLVYGGDGDDILDGGEGNDFLYGGSGNNTYVFGRYYGTDIISDSEGVSTIKMAEGISLDDLDIISVEEDVVIAIKDSEDKLIINGFAENHDNYILEVDGENVSLKDSITADESEFLSGSEESNYIVNENSSVIAGGSGDDRIIGNDEDEIIFGDRGNDQILSGGGNDVIFGGSGDGYINGGDGNDMIDGGSGNDFIDGGLGDDTYFFNPGFGNDSIKDSDGANTIMFGDGFTASDIKAYRSNWNDLLITFDGFDNTLTIKNYCIDKNARNFTLVFADGTVVEAAALDSPLRKVYGTDGSEYMESIYDDGIINDAQESDDQIVGSDANDMLYGGDGDERITGKAGNDILDGGKGNDYLSDGAGNDTYIFNKGYGVDTISDGEGTNTINIYGYSASQIKAHRTNWNDITITFADSEDKIVIEGFFTSEANRNFYLTFNGGGRVHATASNSPLRTIYGTDGDDYMAAMDDRGVTLYGESGADNLNGGGGADRLYGGIGNDQLYGNGGNDTLDGGEGDDMLYGGAGNDTYIFNVGSGTDTIIDSEGINTISFGAGLPENAMTAYRHNWNDLMITFEGIEDKLIIQGYFGSESNRNFEVRFADGTRYAYDDAENPIKQVHATEHDDWMTAWSDNGIALHGDGGNDNLTGGAGDDMLLGGIGNDTLNGNDGDDILDGSAGSDFLYSGLGNDTYRFGIGYGSDIIEDNDGDNKVELLDINSDAVSFEMTNGGELLITVTGSGDVLTIRNFDSERFTFEFADEVSGTFNVETGKFERILSEEELAAIEAVKTEDEENTPDNTDDENKDVFDSLAEEQPGATDEDDVRDDNSTSEPSIENEDATFFETDNASYEALEQDAV